MRILYVEDEPDIRELTCLALRDLGRHHVVDCCCGHTALAAAERGGAFDLLLLDVMMPEIDGRVLLRELRTRPATATVPAIFMTAKTLETEIAELDALGAIHVVSKPFDPLSLSAELTAAVAGKVR